MNMQRVVEVLRNEKECVVRQDTDKCNRDSCGCHMCDLILDTEDVLQAYTLAIGCIEGCEWIPVSKREPEEYGEYIITWTTSHSMAGGKGLIGDAEYELTGEYDHEKNRFKGEWLLPEYIQNYPDVKVTAWMPLPEPYEQQESEAEE